jgi:hypothetical protein
MNMAGESLGSTKGDTKDGPVEGTDSMAADAVVAELERKLAARDRGTEEAGHVA